MEELLRNSWWMLAIRGVLALTFGLLAVVWPGATLLVLVALFAAWALMGGIASVIAAAKNRRTDGKWWLVLLLGLVSIAAGIIAVLNPDITIFVLVLLMGVNALITGALEIAMAVRLRHTMKREWLLALAGAVSVLFGLLVVVFPAAGAIALVWLVSFYATFSGLLLLTLAFRARRWVRGGTQDSDRRPADAAQGHHPAHPAT
jgi:uncharacterized membrane protein HdeD (DUF308 family)